MKNRVKYALAVLMAVSAVVSGTGVEHVYAAGPAEAVTAKTVMIRINMERYLKM